MIRYCLNVTIIISKHKYFDSTCRSIRCSYLAASFVLLFWSLVSPGTPIGTDGKSIGTEGKLLPILAVMKNKKTYRELVYYGSI